MTNLQQILQQEGERLEKSQDNLLHLSNGDGHLWLSKEEVKKFNHESNLRVAKGVLQSVREGIGEDEKEKHEFDCHAYELEERQYECSCGNDCVVKGCNQEKSRLRLASDTMERELEGELS